jgi:hypothetical protein
MFSYFTVRLNKDMQVYLPKSTSNGSEMLDIEFYCKNIQYITASINQIYQFTVHGHTLHNLRVTVVVHKA